jgi:ribonuclease-3
MLWWRPYREIERRLGYRFRHTALLETALIHPSYRHEHPEIGQDNQRLEFLGDAALALAVAVWLYRRYPELTEGELTQRRAALTRSSALAEAGRQLDLGRHIKLGRGELKCGGQSRQKILEDAVEAIIGAVYLDGGMKGVEQIFERTLLPILRQMATTAEYENPKGALLEWCQRNHLDLPVYRVIAERGPMHEREFVVEVCVNSTGTAIGTGRSKKTAEQAAALELLRKIRSAPHA